MLTALTGSLVLVALILEAGVHADLNFARPSNATALRLHRRHLNALANSRDGRQLLSTVLPTTSNPALETQDNRAVVMDTTQYPYNTIGLLTMQSGDSNGDYQECSGALVAANWVLTAAHCVHSPDTGITYPTGKFTPGYDSTLKQPAPFGTVNVIDYVIPVAFLNCGNNGYTSCHQTVDFAIVKLGSTYSSWMSFGYDTTDTGNQIINTAGYPEDIDDCGKAGAECQQFHVSCNDGNIQSSQAYVQTTCYGYHGQSGSPIWLYHASTNTREIIGILASGPTSGGYSSFTLITQSVFQFLKNYMT